MTAGLEIQRVLVLSTGHVSPVTAALLNDKHSDVPWAPQLIWEYGWIWYVDQDTGNGTNFPPEFSSIFALALKHECDWVRFDESGPRIDELPYHDW